MQRGGERLLISVRGFVYVLIKDQERSVMSSVSIGVSTSRCCALCWCRVFFPLFFLFCCTPRTSQIVTSCGRRRCFQLFALFFAFGSIDVSFESSLFLVLILQSRCESFCAVCCCVPCAPALSFALLMLLDVRYLLVHVEGLLRVWRWLYSFVIIFALPRAFCGQLWMTIFVFHFSWLCFSC